jgi:tetratricopeptide (TPR) repeat protein
VEAASAPSPARWEPDEVWVKEDDPVDESSSEASPGPAAGGRPSPAHRFNVPRPVLEELKGSAGAERGAKLAARLADAARAYDHDRYQEARQLLRPLARQMPDAPAVRELLGLVLYRSGEWAAAAKELEAYRGLSGSYDQHPVLADCYRALRRYGAAEELWDDLRRASPSAELVAEGRMVAAGCRADQGDLAGAIALLARADRRMRRPEQHHVRQWYALADLYERAGDIPRARDMFARVAAADGDAYDARRRLRQLG